MNNKDIENRLNEIIKESKIGPDENCKICKGTGKRKVKLIPGSFLQWLRIGFAPCYCLFVKDKKDRDLMIKCMNSIVRKYKKDE